jgi:hypothetical protein
MTLPIGDKINEDTERKFNTFQTVLNYVIPLKNKERNKPPPPPIAITS